ncbi:hypothetical protein ACN28S_34620 [Cystobacter fuscus]
MPREQHLSGVRLARGPLELGELEGLSWALRGTGQQQQRLPERPLRILVVRLPPGPQQINELLALRQQLLEWLSEGEPPPAQQDGASIRILPVPHLQQELAGLGELGDTGARAPRPGADETGLNAEGASVLPRLIEARGELEGEQAETLARLGVVAKRQDDEAVAGVTMG